MIDQAYTLFSKIPLYRDPKGNYATKALWHWDLIRHFEYISDLHLCCPVEHVSEHQADLKYVAELSDDLIYPLRVDRGWGSVFRNLIPNGVGIFRALSKTEIAHSGGAAWPFPESYYILPLRLFFKFKWIIVVEAAFYRMPDHGTASFRQMLSHHLHTFLVKRCVRSADARIFTTQRFQEMFLDAPERSLIAPVVWTKEADIRSNPDFETAKPDGNRRARLIFPSRLIRDKGVQTVLDAIEITAQRAKDQGTEMPQIDILGSGPMTEDCQRVANAYPDEWVRFFDPIPYGDEFFAFLRGYDALIVASLQANGQPRILYDAMSQGLPCIASETIATREAITDGQTGVFFQPGDAASLASCMIEFANRPDLLHEMGRNALVKARSHTHENMHRTREHFLIETLDLSTPANQGQTDANELS
ncbi:MAG: glycosyltransferase family 4 protein [Aliishimia sp.]